MCTAFIHQGEHLICGFNMDINEGAMDYQAYAQPDAFYVGVKAMLPIPRDGELPSHFRLDNGVRKIQGVNRNGVFAVCLNNMNFSKAPFRLAEDALPIDQLMDDCISGHATVEDACRMVREKNMVNVPTGAVEIPSPAFHGFITAPGSPILLVEPGNGWRLLEERYAAMTNYALLELPDDLTPETWGYYGKDRQDTAMVLLRQREAHFTVEDALEILQKTRQTGAWATRVSFVYHSGENAVYYCLQGNFDRITRHFFAG